MFFLKNKESRFRPDLVFGTVERPFMILDGYNILGIEEHIKRAYEELKEHLSKSDDRSHTWGYFPQYCHDESQYQNCIMLGKKLKEGLVSKLPFPESSMSLAFVRIADNKPVSDFGGLHVDVDTGVAHHRDHSVDVGLDVLRLILNLGEYPRIVEYVPLSKDSLRRLGYIIPEEDYKTLPFPEGTIRYRIGIPVREANTIYGLKFWSSQVPHAGITDERGHFIAAFGCYADMNKHKI